MITQVAPALNNSCGDHRQVFALMIEAGDTPTGESIEAAVKLFDGVTDPGPKCWCSRRMASRILCADPNPGDNAGRDAARQLSVTAVQSAFQKQFPRS